MKSSPKAKSGQGGIGSNIAQNHSSSLQKVISGHYLTPIRMKSWPKVKSGKIVVSLNIAENNSSSLLKVISGHTSPQFTWKVDNNQN